MGNDTERFGSIASSGDKTTDVADGNVGLGQSVRDERHVFVTLQMMADELDIAAKASDEDRWGRAMMAISAVSELWPDKVKRWRARSASHHGVGNI